MEKLLGIIITITIVFYLIPIVIRLISPLLMKLFLGKMQKRFEQQFNSAQSQTYDNTSSEGDVTVNYSSQRKTNKNGQTLSEELGGEYVDFEEVK